MFTLLNWRPLRIKINDMKYTTSKFNAYNIKLLHPNPSHVFFVQFNFHYCFTFYYLIFFASELNFGRHQVASTRPQIHLSSRNRYRKESWKTFMWRWRCKSEFDTVHQDDIISQRKCWKSINHPRTRISN